MNLNPNPNHETEDDDLDVPEFDFDNAVPNKFAAQYAGGVAYEILGLDGVKRKFVQLDDDVAGTYFSSKSVNDVLRLAMKQTSQKAA